MVTKTRFPLILIGSIFFHWKEKLIEEGRIFIYFFPGGKEKGDTLEFSLLNRISFERWDNFDESENESLQFRSYPLI